MKTTSPWVPYPGSGPPYGVPLKRDHQPGVAGVGSERRPRDVGGVRRVEGAGLAQVEVEDRVAPRRPRGPSRPSLASTRQAPSRCSSVVPSVASRPVAAPRRTSASSVGPVASAGWKRKNAGALTKPDQPAVVGRAPGAGPTRRPSAARRSGSASGRVSSRWRPVSRSAVVSRQRRPTRTRRAGVRSKSPQVLVATSHRSPSRSRWVAWSPNAPGRSGRRKNRSERWVQLERRRVELPHRGVCGVEEARPGAGRGQQHPPVEAVRRPVGVADQPDVAQPELAEPAGAQPGRRTAGAAGESGQPGLVAGVDPPARGRPAPRAVQVPSAERREDGHVGAGQGQRRARRTGPSGRPWRRRPVLGASGPGRDLEPDAGAVVPRGQPHLAGRQLELELTGVRGNESAVIAAYGASCGVGCGPGASVSTATESARPGRPVGCGRSPRSAAAPPSLPVTRLSGDRRSPAGGRRRRPRPRRSARPASARAPSV